MDSFTDIINRNNEISKIQMLKNAGIGNYDSNNILQSAFKANYGIPNTAPYTPTLNSVYNNNSPYRQPEKKPDPDETAQNANKGMSIASDVFKGIGTLTNAGLGIWGAIEQSKLIKEQMANMQAQRNMWAEQVAASREARTQRRQELARLNKMRSNTKAQFNTQATVTRSY